MPHRFQKIDWKKTLDSIPKDVADLLQKGFDEQNEKDFISLCTSLKQGKCSLCDILWITMMRMHHVFIFF